MIQLPDGEYCVDWDNPTIPLGCMDAKMGCGDAITIAGEAGSGTDGCYWFPQTCIPTDWEVAASDMWNANENLTRDAQRSG